MKKVMPKVARAIKSDSNSFFEGKNSRAMVAAK